MNALWAGMMLMAIIYGTFHGTIPAVTQAALDSAKEAVSPVSYTHLDVYKRQVLNVFAYRGIELKVTPMIEATGIIWVTLLAASILGERPTKRTILSIVITVIGIIVFSL